MLRLFAALALAVALARAQTGVVEGTVLNSVTRAGIPGASVDLRPLQSPSPVPIYHADTDPAGAFRIEGVAPGTYQVSFEAPHFTSIAGARILVSVGGATTHLGGRLDPISVFDGRVLDAKRHPLPGVRVDLFSRTTRQGIISMRTGKDGAFHFPNVLPGAYFLVARPNIPVKLPNAPADKPAEEDRKAQAPTYYPGVTDFASAVAVQARGGEVTGLDIRMAAANVFHVRGIVRDERGRPLAEVPLTLRPADFWPVLEMISDPDAQTVSSADGSFDFPNVAAGLWRIAAQHEDERGFAIASMTTHDRDGVEVRLSRPFTIEGTVEWDGAPKPARSRAVLATTLSPVDGPFANRAYGTPTDEGVLRFKDVYPGRHKIQAPPSQGYYVAAVLLGGRDVLGQEVELAQGSGPLRIVYKSGGGSVHGTVDNGEGATVVLLPTEESLLDTGFPKVTCEPGGKFDIQGVRPGEYHALAFFRIEPDLLQEPAFVRGLIPYAVSVHIKDAEPVSLELRLTAWPM